MSFLDLHAKGAYDNVGGETDSVHRKDFSNFLFVHTIFVE